MMDICSSHATVLVGDVNENVENRECSRRGCSDPAADDSELCESHADDQRRYQREYMARQRKAWDDAKRCNRCGAERRAQNSHWCAGCLITTGKAPRPVVKQNVENRVSRDYVEVDGYARTRGHGQGKRGAPSIDDCDDFDRKVMDDGMRRYRDGMEYLASEAGKALCRADRDKARMAALGQLDLALRAGEEITERHRYRDKLAKAEQRKTDDRIKERERKLAGLAREIAKSGR